MSEPRALTEAGVSDREAEVLALVGQHRTNAEIAARLFISVRTVESHVSSLLRKLAMSDRRALAELARDLDVGGRSPGQVAPERPGTALPSPLTSFVGRASERAELAEALTRHRLVTAVGPGGVGKTRLALAVAGDVTARYAAGAWYVDLVPVTDPTMVGDAVTSALGIGEQFVRSPTETLIARLADAEALIVLDNCEHVVDGVVAFVERIVRCPGLLTELPPAGEEAGLVAEAGQLAGDDPEVAAAIVMLQAGMEVEAPDEQRAERAAELAGRTPDHRLASAALDQLTVVQLAQGRVFDAAATTRRRLDQLVHLPVDVEIAFELTDGLHMGAEASVGAGDLPTARHYAERRRELLFHWGEDHLLVNWLMIVDALAGELDHVVELAERFRVGWERLGRLRLPGAAATPAAAAMAYGLKADEVRRGQWLEIFTAMHRIVSEAWPWPETGYGPTFDALVALHRGDADAAMAELAAGPDSLTRAHTAVWRPWYAALRAEAWVLAARSEASQELAAARAVAAGNPIATAIVDRADALATDDRGGLLRTAAAFEAAGCRYQRARTLVLAGDDERAEGEALLAALGAAPMAV